jgi:hypothetical protein
MTQVVHVVVDVAYYANQAVLTMVDIGSAAFAHVCPAATSSSPSVMHGSIYQALARMCLKLQGTLEATRHVTTMLDLTSRLRGCEGCHGTVEGISSLPSVGCMMCCKWQEICREACQQLQPSTLA